MYIICNTNEIRCKEEKTLPYAFLTPILGMCSIAAGLEVEAVMRKTQALSLRVSTEFKRRLIEEAKKDRRSIANYIEATLIKLWQEKDSEGLRMSKGKN